MICQIKVSTSYILIYVLFSSTLSRLLPLPTDFVFLISSYSLIVSFLFSFSFAIHKQMSLLSSFFHFSFSFFLVFVVFSNYLIPFLFLFTILPSLSFKKVLLFSYLLVICLPHIICLKLTQVSPLFTHLHFTSCLSLTFLTLTHLPLSFSFSILLSFSYLSMFCLPFSLSTI